MSMVLAGASGGIEARFAELARREAVACAPYPAELP